MLISCYCPSSGRLPGATLAKSTVAFEIMPCTLERRRPPRSIAHPTPSTLRVRRISRKSSAYNARRLSFACCGIAVRAPPSSSVRSTYGKVARQKPVRVILRDGDWVEVEGEVVNDNRVNLEKYSVLDRC